MSPQRISAYVLLFRTVAHGDLWLEERLEKAPASRDSVMKANKEDRDCGWVMLSSQRCCVWHIRFLLNAVMVMTVTDSPPHALPKIPVIGS